jgi:hypothetical protein
MTNIRSRGFDSPAQLFENLDEVDADPTDRSDDAAFADDSEASRLEVAWVRELAWLCKDVADINETLSFMREQSDGGVDERDKRPRWVGVAALAAAFVTVKLVDSIRAHATPAARRLR